VHLRSRSDEKLKRSALSAYGMYQIWGRRIASRHYAPSKPHYEPELIYIMAERQVPWRARPTQEVLELIQQLQETRLYLMHRPGPTSFMIHEDAGNTNKKVTIGCIPTCTWWALKFFLSWDQNPLNAQVLSVKSEAIFQ
jgi:hypothetical protein